MQIDTYGTGGGELELQISPYFIFNKKATKPGCFTTLCPRLGKIIHYMYIHIHTLIPHFNGQKEGNIGIIMPIVHSYQH